MLNMNDWRETVLLTLRQDLFDLTSLAKCIQQTVQYEGINSWMYPSRNSKDVLQANVSEDVVYTNCLELLIDRIYIIFNLYVFYFESKRHKSCGASRPKNLTLAGCAKLLWTKLTMGPFVKNVPDGKTKTVISIEHAQVQTENDSLLNCDSCVVAFKCIKDILAILESSLESSNTTEMKQALHTKIFDISLFACMANLCSAIEEDISYLVKENSQLRENSKKEEDQKCADMTLLDKILKENKDLQGKNEKTEKNLETLKSEYKNLAELNKKLEKVVVRKEDDLKSYYLQMHDLKNRMDKLYNENENLKKALNKALTNNESLEEQLENCKEQNEKEIIKLSNNLNEIENNFNKCEIRRVRNEECTELLFNRYEQIIKNLQKIVKKKVIDQEIAISALDRGDGNNLSDTNEVKGNPVDDILTQISLNDAKMKSLKLENNKLLTLVSKINEIKY